MNIYTKKIDMTLYNIVSILKAIAASQPNIRTTTDGSVYDALNTNPAIQYDVFHISQTNHREDENYDYYGFNLFYISRLEDSLEDNRLQIQSIGKEVLSNIIRSLCENWSIDYPVITYFPFTQRFNDLCAGVYCSLQLDVPKELWCADDYIAEVVPGKDIKLQDLGITITQNGLTVVTPDAEYDGIGEIRIVTDVPQTTADLQYKEVEYTENGEYVVRPDQDYDGLTEVAVSVDVPDRYEEGYDDGKEDGIEEQKGKLTVTSFTENDTYTRADGWSAITVNVPQGQGYEEGYEDGIANQKAKLSGITITENGNYNREDGYSAITVNVPSIITNQEKNIVINDNTNPLTWFPELGAYALQTPLRVSADSGYTGIEPAIVDVYCDASEAIQYGYDEGAAAEKAKLIATSFTQNDTYEKASGGWSSVTVNVADRYDEGYADGFAAGASACGAFFITALTLNVDSAITDSGTATTTYSPSTAFTDIHYTSSNHSIADIDELTGEITVISNGTVTICAIDNFTRLQDCKEVSVELSPAVPTGITLNVNPVIISSATATTTVSPSGAISDIYYTSSDTTKATINQNTGAISAIAEGSTTICTNDRISGLQDCKNVYVVGSASSRWLAVTYSGSGSSYRTLVISNGNGSYDMVTDGRKLVTGNVTGWTGDTSYSGPVTLYFHLTGNTIKSEEFRSNYDSHSDTPLSPITKVVIPSGVTTIESYAFARNRTLTSVTISDSVTSIGNSAFAYNTALTQYNLESLTGLTTISDNVFNGTAKQDVVIPSSVTSIGTSAFAGTKTKSIIIPASVRSIGPYALCLRGSSPSITFLGTNPPTVSYCNLSCCITTSYIIYVPASAVNTYKAALPDEADHITAIIP